MNNSIENSISTNELLTQYSWYKDTFSTVIQNASDEFFSQNFRIELIGLSKNINCLLNNESCFVTKVNIEKDYDMFFRLTDKAIEIILDKTLGKGKGRFNINKISELETKIITSFNSYLFKGLKEKLNPPNPKELKRNNFDMINMTFIIKDLDPNVKSAGKIIITVPQILTSPEVISSTSEKFSKGDFNLSEITAKVVVGKTSFTLYDLKNLETDDVVVFEDSNINKLKISILGEEMDVNISPNTDLIIAQNRTEGDNNMSETHNLWDSIEVDMNAEFDSVKITLGDLKKIESGLVVDLTSLYENNVTLKVENKPIASGSLVIVNDRYGVKIDKIYAGSTDSQQDNAQNSDEENFKNSEPNEEYTNQNGDENYTSDQEQGADNNFEEDEGGGEEDFDYSDFELEDEGI